MAFQPTPQPLGVSIMDAIVGILGASVLAIFGWAVNLNAKVRVLEQRHEDFLEFLNTQFEDVKDRLGRIETTLNRKMKP